MNLQVKSFEEYQQSYQLSVDNPEVFWANIAEHFTWKKKWDRVLDWNFTEPKIEWFGGAKLNITENCLDRHLENNGDDIAIIWESNDPDEASRNISYRELHQQVCTFSNVLKQNGAKKGDRICLYMPMIPELEVAVLACARIGAIHSVVFGGFSAQSIADRIIDAACAFVITADGGHRGNKEIPLKSVIDDSLIGNKTVKKIMDEALISCPSVERVIVVERSKSAISMEKGRDVFYDQEMSRMESLGLTDFAAEPMDSEDPLFILYTSGSTGKPKGVVHTCGGYMVFATYTFQNIFQYKKGQIYFCTADIGWITGHSYIVYGPLASGATSLMFEGIPTFPDAGRFWDIVEKFKVNILYTAPTAIRSLMAFGLDFVKNKDLSSLQVLGSVGEPINEEAWNWYNEHIGKKNCPIVDTWWQTETGGIMISPLAYLTPTKPCYATLPLPGIQPILVDEKGEEIIGNGVSGNLCIKFPWPGMIRTTYGDHERCKTTYFATYENLYFTGDGCLRDEDGYYRITGRVDDVMNISGHRIGTAEVENAINMHAGVIESAVVAYPHDIKGQGIYAYVILDNATHDPTQIKKDISATVTKIIGAIARPDKIQIVSGLPKTRSGKIMRRILRKIAEGDVSNLGDTSTLLDPAVVEKIKDERI